MAPLAGASSQTPSVAPSAMVHFPPQHSLAVRQVSPAWRQYDGAGEQSPSRQYFEQQSPGAAQGLPEVLQASFSGTHTSFVQTPPQHSAPAVQASPSGVHWSAEHSPSTHEKEQQSGPLSHASPEPTQSPGPSPRRCRRPCRFRPARASRRCRPCRTCRSFRRSSPCQLPLRFRSCRSRHRLRSTSRRCKLRRRARRQDLPRSG